MWFPLKKGNKGLRTGLPVIIGSIGRFIVSGGVEKFLYG